MEQCLVMPKWRMIESIVKNRNCGAYWQDRGLKVIPTVFWALKSSFSFCFEAIEKHSIVAVSTLGCMTMLQRLSA